MAIKEIKLNAQNFDTMKKFAMVQGDSARVLRCYVDVDLSTVTEARIYIKKADGTEIYNDCVVTNQYIDVPLTTQALAVVGDQVAQLHLKDGNGYITTYKFILQVLKSYVSGSAIESSNEFTALENALTEVEEFGAKNLVYDNEESGLEASNIQDAIDELANNPSGVYVGDEPPAKATTWIDTSEDVGGGTFVDLYRMEVNKVPIEGLNTTDKTVEGAINELNNLKNFAFGNPINITNSLPYTCAKGGFVYLYSNPKSSTSTYSFYKNDYKNTSLYIRTNTSGGRAESCYALAPQGSVISFNSGSGSENVTDVLLFIPFT